MSTTWGQGQKFASDLIQLMTIGDFKQFVLFGRVLWESGGGGRQVVVEDRWWDLKIMWSDEDFLVGGPKSPIACSSKWASGPFT